MTRGPLSLLLTLAFCFCGPALAGDGRTAAQCAASMGKGVLAVSSAALKDRLVADLGRLALLEDFPYRQTATALALRIASGQWTVGFEEDGVIPQPGALLTTASGSPVVLITNEGLQALADARRLNPAFDLPVMVITNPEQERSRPHWPAYGRWLVAVAQLVARVNSDWHDAEASALNRLIAEIRTGIDLRSRWGMAPGKPLEMQLILRVAGPMSAALTAEDYDRVAQLFAPARYSRLQEDVAAMAPHKRQRYFRELLGLHVGPLSGLGLAIAERDADLRIIALLREMGARSALAAIIAKTSPGSPLVADAQRAVRIVDTALMLNMDRR